MSDDMDGEVCAAAGCFQPAGTMATARVKLHPLVGAAPEEAYVVLEIPLCIAKHAHLLRMGVTSCELDSRLT